MAEMQIVQEHTIGPLRAVQDFTRSE